MTVFRRGKYWHMSKQVDGVRIRQAIKTARTKAEALQAEAHIVNQLHKKKYDEPEPPEPARVLFKNYARGAFMDYYKANNRSYADAERIVDMWCDLLGDALINEITPSMIEHLKQQRLSGETQYKRPRKPGTVKRELSVLSRIFSLAVQDDDVPITANPCLKVKRIEPNDERIRYLSPDEEAALLKELEHQPQTRNIIIFAMMTGCRRGEIFDLRWRHVDFERGVINIIKTKTKRSRVVMMNPNPVLLALMKELRAQAPNAGRDAFVFPSEKTGERLTDIKHSFHSALKRAGIEDFRFHDLRHTAGTWLADSGAHITVIASILGHSRTSTTERYVHAVDAAKREAMAKLASKSVLGKQAAEGEKTR